MKQRKSTKQTVSLSELKSTLLKEARSIDLPEGAAREVIAKVLAETEAWLKNKTVVTEADFERTVSRFLKKYHPDLAYIYHNRDKII